MVVWPGLLKQKAPAMGGGNFLSKEASVAAMLFLFVLLFFLLVLLVLRSARLKTCESNSGSEGYENSGGDYFLHTSKFRLLSYEEL
jgi:hypothetical protein